MNEKQQEGKTTGRRCFAFHLVSLEPFFEHSPRGGGSIRIKDKVPKKLEGKGGIPPFVYLGGALACYAHNGYLCGVLVATPAGAI